MRLVALKAAFVGAATLVINGLPRIFKGWYALRHAFRQDIIRCAKLQPRPSDEEWGMKVALGEPDEISIASLATEVQSSAPMGMTFANLKEYVEYTGIQVALGEMRMYFEQIDLSKGCNTYCI